MEGDPFAVIEAMTIAAYATGCEHGYIYLRGEYPLAHARARARDRRRPASAGSSARDVLGHGFAFDIEVRKGAGAYICGEETAIFGSIEGYRGEPRNKPPFPVVEGLFRQPTVVNNVETLVNVLSIVLEGGRGVRRGSGPSARPGRSCSACRGAVERPGTYEVAVRHDAARPARARGRRRRRTCAPCCSAAPPACSSRPSELDLRAHVRGRARAGRHARLGRRRWRSTTDGPQPAADGASRRSSATRAAASACRAASARCARRRRSRGCCRDGPAGPSQDELALIAEIGAAMRDASICGLGQTASSAIESAIGKLGVFA